MAEEASIEEIDRRFRRWAWVVVPAGVLVYLLVRLCFVDERPGWRPRQAVVAGMGFGACMGYTGIDPRLMVVVDDERVDLHVENWEFRRPFGPVVTVLVHPEGAKKGVSLQRPFGDWYYRTLLWAMWSPEKVKRRNE